MTLPSLQQEELPAQKPSPEVIRGAFNTNQLLLNMNFESSYLLQACRERYASDIKKRQQNGYAVRVPPFARLCLRNVEIG